MKSNIAFCLSLVIALILSCDCHYFAEGAVIDQETGQPIEGVVIRKGDLKTGLASEKVGTTGPDGYFSVDKISRTCDWFSWYFSHPGYEKRRADLKQNANDTIYLVPKGRPIAAKFDQEAPFELINLKKSSDYPSSDTTTSVCQSWILYAEEIAEIMMQAKPITGLEWHYDFSHLPCQYTGQLAQGDQVFQLSFNSGAWFTLLSKDTLFRYGSYEAIHKAYFLSHALAEEDVQEK